MDEEAIQVINAAFENLRQTVLTDTTISKVEFEMTFSDISLDEASQVAYYPHIVVRIERN
jgi:hypothetical protein